MDGCESSEQIISHSVFRLNQASREGGAISCEDSKLDIMFIGGHSDSNSASMGGFLYLSSCSVSIQGQFSMIGNRARLGGAVFSVRSEIYIPAVPLLRSLAEPAEVSLVGNTAEVRGGAIMTGYSTIYIGFRGKLIFTSNVVTSPDGEGGAVLIQDNVDCRSGQRCPIGYDDYDREDKHIFFYNNSATHGSALFGGLLDRCFLYKPVKGLGRFYFKQDSLIVPQTPLAITSRPVTLCFCMHNDQLDCELIYSPHVQKMRGESVEVRVTSVDQDRNPVPSVIRANYRRTSAQLGEGEGRNSITNCTTLQYHVFTADSSAKLTLHTEGFCERSVNAQLQVHIQIVNCSRGFEQDKDRCVCDRRLTKHLNVALCFIDTQSVERRTPIWFSYYDGEYLKMAADCPLDYCEVTTETISLLSPDDQCAFNRSGILCGACQNNYSIALGGSKCLPCANRYTFIWLVLVFAVAGVALVALLLLCNMTISHGTLNGLIFYANVVSIRGITSVHNCTVHPILSVFIAWVNLDFGVETCFYPGMDTYQKTWLQFAFPLYIILLVAAILVASHYSSTAVKVFGRNSIAILATLFLLSYSKALKAIITALSATQILISEVDNVRAPVMPYRVWSYDGNIEYLKGKHVILFTVSLMFLLVMFLPYTLLLTFGQCLRGSRPLLRRRWISQLTRSTGFISIMDAYHAPYNRRHRYWTGLTLLARCVLFLAFATNYSNETIVGNSYITTIVVFAVILAKTYTTKVYRRFRMNLLELSFLCNLEVLSATLYHLRNTGTSDDTTSCKVTNASIAISFVTFVGIVAYHAYLQVQGTRWYRSAWERLLSKFPTRQRQVIPANDEQLTSIKGFSLEGLPSTTEVGLREELLASADDN